MYLVGKGHEHMGPGTSMVQRIEWSRANESQLRNAMRGVAGLGEVGCVPEFRADCSQMRTTCSDFRGFGACGCTKPNMNCGMGLFDSGMDFKTWGVAEWAIVGVGVYAGLSLLGDTKRGVQRVGRVGRAVRKAA